MRAAEPVRRGRGGWSRCSRAYLEHVQELLEGLRDYWPLTLRQAYYQLVAEGYIENAQPAYRKLSRILTKARLDGLVPWEAIEDRVRTTLESGGWEDSGSFVSQELAGFLAGYRRDLLQSQDVALEVWVEKDALSRICHDVAFPYCVPVVVARGFSSVSYVHECRQRVLRNVGEGKSTRILYFGDLDPSGWEMLPAMLVTLQEEMDLGSLVEGVRCALVPEQVEAYGLPRSIDALKRTDPRAKKYVERFGDLAVELDALPPATLGNLVREAIEGQLDMGLLRAELALEREERESVADLRDRVHAFVETELSAGGGA